MIQIEVNIDDEVSAELREFMSLLSGEDMKDLNQVGARSAINAASEFHRDFNLKGGWRGKYYMQGSVGRPGEFGDNVAQGWSFRSSDSSGATIGNNADYYAFKVRGGTIVPKRVSFLTIPLIPDAKGRRAKDYEINFNRRLFKPRGKYVLMEKTDSGEVRGVYALVKSVTIPAMPSAIPPRELLADEFSKGWIDALTDKIELL